MSRARAGSVSGIKDLEFEVARQKLLPAANGLFLLAHMEGIVRDYMVSKDITDITEVPDDILSKSYAAARKISNIYIKEYSNPKRKYHGLKHPRTQLPDESVQAILKSNKKELENADKNYQGLRELLLNPKKLKMTSEAFEALRIFDRHDVLHVVDPAQATLISEYISPAKLNITIPGTKVTIGDLMSKCSLAVMSANDGMSELSSATFAIDKENISRKASGFNILSARESVDTIMALAATIPFKDKNYLNDMGEKLAEFLKLNPDLRKALGVDEKGIDLLVDDIMIKAGNIANRDISQFFAHPLDLRGGDRLQEQLVIANDSTSPLQQFNLAFPGWNKHSPASVRTIEIGLDGKDHFIYGNGANGRLSHGYKKRTGGVGIDVSLDIEKYMEVIAPATATEHGKDMLLAVLQMVAPTQIATQGITSRDNISLEMLKGFLPQVFENGKVVTTGANTNLLKTVIAQLHKPFADVPFTGKDVQQILPPENLKALQEVFTPELVKSLSEKAAFATNTRRASGTPRSSLTGMNASEQRRSSLEGTRGRGSSFEDGIKAGGVPDFN